MPKRMKVPNHTQFPNIIIDEQLHSMTLAEVKCIIAIVRKTIGWQKLTDRMSYSQLREITGLSVNAIKRGVMGLEKRHLISKTKTKFGYRYDMNFEETPKKDMSTTDTAISTTDTTVSTIDTTKETNKKETNIYINIELAFRNAFKKATGEEYRIQYAKDRKLLKPLITKYGEDKILKLIDVWFCDDFGEKCGYTIGGFSSCFNKLLMKPAQKMKAKDTRKTLDEMEALRQDKKVHPEKYKIPKEE